MAIRVSRHTRALVAKRSNAQMMSTIQILRGALGDLNTTTGVVGGIKNATTIYSGPARIWSVEGSGIITLGNSTIDTRTTYISIPAAATPVPRRDDLVKVIEDDEADADLNARIFRVMEVDGGGYVSETRKLTCASYYPSRYWGE